MLTHSDLKKMKNRVDLVFENRYDAFRSFVFQWNHQFIIDRWFRKKYSIAFNSQEHRELSFEDILIDFVEDKEFNKLNKVSEEYKANVGDFITRREDKKQSYRDFMDEVNNIDLSQFDLCQNK